MAKIIDKRERVLQIYNWYRTARLNVLYYEASLRTWSNLVRGHDILTGLAGAGSPIAFLKRSPTGTGQTFWFCLTLVAAVLALLKPILRWDNQVKFYAELESQYCDLYMDLKYLSEDIAATSDLPDEFDALFVHYRGAFKALEKKEPPQSKWKTARLQKRVNQEININSLWLPNSGKDTPNV